MDFERKGPVKQQTFAGQSPPSHSQEQHTTSHAQMLMVLEAMATASTRSLEEIGVHFANTIQQNLSIEHVMLLLIDKEQNILEPIGSNVVTNLKNGKRSKLQLGQGLAGWAAEHSITVRVGDVTKDSRHTTADALWPSDIRSELAIPLMTGDQVIGVIDTASSHLDAFNDADEHLMTALAQQLVIVIENTRRYHEAEKQLAEMSALYQLAQRINASLNIQQVLESIVWSLKETMGCRGCSIALLNPVNNVLEIRTAVGVEHKWERDFRLRLGEGIAGRVALEGKSIYVPDVSKEENFIYFDPSVQSLLTVPMTLQQRVIGTLTVDSDQSNAFNKSNERLLIIAATQAAIAIENAQLYASLEQRAQNLAEAYAELKQSDRLKGEMVQNVSHELRTPLTFIKSYIKLLLDQDMETLDAEQKKYLKIISEKTDIVTQLVNNIMVMQQTDRVSIKREPVSLTELARQAVQKHTDKAREAGLTLVENMDDSPLVVGDKEQLLRVFDNLLNNAIKFSPHNGQIIVSVEDAGTMILASISDQGIGIPQDQQKQIFERFYQIDGSARRRFGGAGLGLAIVKRILEAHEGQTWVESEPGKGSTFYITVPKYQAD
ncbi:MAG: GAF domain-containing sensor histidine kinase [Chloroflexi bacterium]|nr:GAF domain-containing sensor histidine kinase [Chloroflexota bacterium]